LFKNFIKGNFVLEIQYVIFVNIIITQLFNINLWKMVTSVLGHLLKTLNDKIL